MPEKYCVICGRKLVIRAPSRWHRTKTCSIDCRNRNIQRVLSGRIDPRAADRRPPVEQPQDHRLIALTQGKVALVDIEDHDLARLNWTHTVKGYARRTVGPGKRNERMHRVVMARKLGRRLLPSEQVDHINRDRLDNRRSNLRLATTAQNSTNASRRHLHYRGVARNHERWCAKIMVDGNTYYLGTYDTAEEAAYVYDQFAIALHGEFAVLNVL